MKKVSVRQKELDRYFMSRCLELAQKGVGHVSPNPLVGCVIVKNGKILAEGYHQQLGGAHAEIHTLQKLKYRAKGATLYCNLEPCFHKGRTGPCVAVILKSGVKRVVIAHPDPNPKVAGRSIRLLRQSGIKVDVGVLRAKAQFLNRIFMTWMTKQRPYVVLKVAMSLDGKITPPHKKGGWITGLPARRRVHEMRSQLDSILVGVQTIITDNPRLNVRGVKRSQQPLRVILDSKLRTPLHSRIFKTPGGPIVLVACESKKILAKLKRFNKKEVAVLTLRSKDKQVPLSSLLKKLAQYDVSSVLVEGGSKVLSSFINERVCDELIVFISPQIFGSKGLDAFSDLQRTGSKTRIPLPFKFHSLSCVGNDLELRYLRDGLRTLG